MDKKIVFIEDDEFFAGVYQDYLDANGFDVFLAGLADDGLKLIKREKPDLIVLALLLPDVEDDLFSILKIIKNVSDISHIPVVILSNISQQDDVREALDLGANTFLIKAHTTPMMLLNVVKRLLNI